MLEPNDQTAVRRYFITNTGRPKFVSTIEIQGFRISDHSYHYMSQWKEMKVRMHINHHSQNRSCFRQNGDHHPDNLNSHCHRSQHEMATKGIILRVVKRCRSVSMKCLEMGEQTMKSYISGLMAIPITCKISYTTFPSKAYVTDRHISRQGTKDQTIFL